MIKVVKSEKEIETELRAALCNIDSSDDFVKRVFDLLPDKYDREQLLGYIEAYHVHDAERVTRFLMICGGRGQNETVLDISKWE